MQDDNRVVAGEWWSKGENTENYFSVEEGIAETLGISIGRQLKLFYCRSRNKRQGC